MVEYNSSFTGAHNDEYDSRLSILELWKNNLLNIVYPIGSFYISANSTNPSTLFGGTWILIKDTFILAAGDDYTAGDSGGSATMAHTHTLSHTHTIAHTHTEGNLSAAIGATGSDPASLGYTAIGRNSRGPSSVTSYTIFGASFSSSSRGYNHYTPVYGTTSESSASSSGGASTTKTSGASNTNNMPPYLVAYIWLRTA